MLNFWLDLPTPWVEKTSPWLEIYTAGTSLPTLLNSNFPTHAQLSVLCTYHAGFSTHAQLWHFNQATATPQILMFISNPTNRYKNRCTCIVLITLQAIRIQIFILIQPEIPNGVVGHNQAWINTHRNRNRPRFRFHLWNGQTCRCVCLCFSVWICLNS